MDENVEVVVTKSAPQFSETEIGGVPYLPECIVHNILARLPVKSLVGFKRVCKYWRDIISELDHIIVRQLMPKVMIIYPTEGCYRNLFFKLKNNGKDCCLCFERKYIWVEKACKNFVLLRYKSETTGVGDMLFVYDTIDHQCRQLPEIPKLDIWKRNIYSLVHEAFAVTWKVITCSHYWQAYYICSLINGRENWRELCFPRSQKIMESCFPIDLNGVLYTVAKDGYHGVIIQSLDIATEKLMSIIKVPCRHWNINCNLLKIKGSLCFMNTDSSEELHIWVLEDSVESIWIPQYKISLSSMVHRPVSLCSFLQDGFHPRLVVEGSSTTYILVTIDGISAPYWYNMKTKELSQITLDCNNLEACGLRTVSFIDFDFDLAPEFEDLVPDLEDMIREYWYMAQRRLDTHRINVIKYG